MDVRIDFMLKDAASVGAAARRHLAALLKCGFAKSELERHERLLASVEEALAERNALAEQVADDVSVRVAAFERAIDGLAFARRAARVAFGAPGAKEQAALRGFGVGAPVAKSQAALERGLALLNRAFSKKSWRSAMEKCGFTAEIHRKLVADVAAADAAVAEKGASASARRRAAKKLGEDLRALRASTAFVRSAGNLAFHGEPEQADFDPPARAGKRAKKPEPASAASGSAA